MIYDKEELFKIVNQREDVFKAVIQLLIEYNYKIIDYYIDESTFSTNFSINTTAFTVDLVLLYYSEYNDTLFDEINIFTNNDSLFTYKITTNTFKKNDIINLLKNNISHFTT